MGKKNFLMGKKNFTHFQVYSLPDVLGGNTAIVPKILLVIVKKLGSSLLEGSCGALHPLKKIPLGKWGFRGKSFRALKFWPFNWIWYLVAWEIFNVGPLNFVIFTNMSWCCYCSGHLHVELLHWGPGAYQHFWINEEFHFFEGLTTKFLVPAMPPLFEPSYAYPFYENLINTSRPVLSF